MLRLLVTAILGFLLWVLFRKRDFDGQPLERPTPVQRPGGQSISVAPVQVTLPRGGGTVPIEFRRGPNTTLRVGELRVPAGAVNDDTVVTVEVPRGSSRYEIRTTPDTRFNTPVILALFYDPVVKNKGDRFVICQLNSAGQCVVDFASEDDGNSVSAPLHHLSRYAIASN